MAANAVAARTSWPLDRPERRCVARGLLLALLAAAAVALPASGQRPSTPAVRLYALDCGRLEVRNMGAFSDTGEHEGEQGTMAVPCYLVRHGSGGWLLWDTGLGDEIAATPEGEERLGFRFVVRRTLRSQLAALGLGPGDVRTVALSHLHADHSGNIGLFPDATFLVDARELAWARGRPAPAGVIPELIAPLDRARIEALDGDRDVFGDGSVRILRTPGHTPGHRALLVVLPNAGPLLITGDLYHTRENRDRGLIPDGNTDRADTLASFDRFARLAANTGARVVVQHAPEDFAAMPAFPGFLDRSAFHRGSRMGRRDERGSMVPVCGATGPRRWGTVAGAPNRTRPRVAARRHHQPAREARRRPSAKRQAEMVDDVPEPRRPARAGREHVRVEALGGDPPPAQDGVAAEPERKDHQAHGPSRDRQVHRAPGQRL